MHFAITILAISFLIFFHELGHYLAARQLGVAINVFSIGFGEKVYSKKIGNTEYAISSIPLGGYVSLKGQEDLDPNLKNYDKDSYNSLSPLGRIYILFAGPFFNIILAFFIYIALGYIGVEKLAPTIGYIGENSAASSANLVVNDKILSIDEKPIREWDDIKKLVKLEPVNLEILRDEKIINISVTPKIGQSKTIFGEDIEKPLIGIGPKGDLVTLYNKGLNSFSFALDETIKASKLIVVSVEKLVTGVVPVKEMGGIVAMADITTKAAGISISVLLLIVALISVNLGVLNLFPIPVLDGGHIVFNIYELIFKKPVPQKVFAAFSYVGMACLVTLMLFTIFNDFFRLFGGYANG
ncbi:RIP metalloprotease RseP [Campylobacter blaseri]|uniref:Zinc metalloprotease n=1 Tax=Campylobacter blaseri TaxID=2042961 RepID=A0A2P8R2S0_9BACT|nr:RIP metalloprotease RseP [Campylobacter blaseri]PSM52791.1 RIP metalloprotease RseP [Campylobacter blaseri]PSM54439.1 RIP metalloprotease RseP [Campylobacter blaseri]